MCRRVMAEGLRWDDVEVVVTDPDAYGIALDALAQQLDVGVTMLKGIPLVRTRLGRALERWFAWLENGLPADVLRQALEAGEIGIEDAIHPVDAARIARYLRSERIGWGRARYQAFIDRVEAMPGERVADPDDGESPEESNEIDMRDEAHRWALAQLLRRLLFITPEVPERGAVGSLRTSAADLARHALEFIEMVPVSAGAEQQTKERLTRRLDFLAGVDDEDIEFSRAMLALRDGLSDLRSWPPTDDTRKPYRAGGGMLHLTDIAHAGATGRPRTFIVGLDAERVGGGARQDPLIPDVARRAFGDGRLPDVNARRAAWTESLGVALSSLRGHVTLSYAIRTGSEGRDCGPSPLLLQVHRINSGDGRLTFEHLRAALAPPACAVPHTGVNAAGAALDARDVWLQAIAGDALMLDADIAVRAAFPMLAAGLDAHALHDGDVLSACHGLVPMAGAALDPTRTDAPSLSPSALEQIGKCPLQWFYRKGLGIHAERDPEFDADAWLDAIERGSLLHKVFENFVLAYTHRQPEVLLPEAESALREMTTAVIDEWRVHEPPPSESVCATESAEVHRAARAFLQMEREALLRGEAATWEATEFPFGVVVPAHYTLTDGRRIVLRGVADRIDRMADGTLRIVDYKTGNPKKYRPGGKRGPYDGGRLLQPALYADAIAAERGSAVSAFEYRFPTDKGGNAIVAYPVESLGAAREVITALVDHVSQGRFLPTTDASDCRHLRSRSDLSRLDVGLRNGLAACRVGGACGGDDAGVSVDADAPRQGVGRGGRMTQLPPDQEARERIEKDLDTNLLVEAGAGSGKTTALVARLLQHVIRGTPVEQIAAVTFTRKAADELRERFQLQLELAVRLGNGSPEENARCAAALRELDRAFLGTIHAFCARLLRERPLEVGLDPNFTEIPEMDVEPMNRDFWRGWIDAARRLDDPDLLALQACGIDPSMLHDAFQAAMLYPDVEFASPAVAVPELHLCRSALGTLLSDAAALMPAATPADGPDALMELVRRLQFHRTLSDWNDPVVFCALLETLAASQMKPVQKRWSDTKEGKAAAKQLGEAFDAWFADVATPLIRQWREHRYPVVMRLLRRAVADFAAARHEAGTLGFDDLLLLTARLLREHPAVRRDLGRRYRYLLVDEFQDTDPVQAEVCLLLASEPAEGDDWHSVTPRAGGLFVVGDPKQSIYRFRRADIQIYERVKARFDAFGATLALTSNFRSSPDIAVLVNTHFTEKLPASASAEQAAFSPLVPAREPRAGHTAGVFRYVIEYDGGGGPAIVALDAETVATWIASRIAAGETPGSFLVLTERKHPIADYARALADRNIPVTTTGASLTQEHELREVLVVLRALADPENAVLVVAALEGVLFGLTPADLFAARRAGHTLSIASPPATGDLPVAQALRTLHAWWTWSRALPTDVLLERVLDETGLLYHAAGSVLGDARAGALLHLVETVRSAGAEGRSGLTDAITLLAELLESEADDAPLRPGRSDAVRVMNLHKAKGLEADIVVLAAPTDRKEHEPLVHVMRTAHGVATGGLLISTGSGNTRQRLAQPVGWEAMQATEARFQRAEEDRLRYVATTRARRAIVVAQALKHGKTAKPDASIWRALSPTVDALAPVPVSITAVPAAGRQLLTIPATRLQSDAATARARVQSARAVTLVTRTVTGVIKGDDDGDEVRAQGTGAASNVGGREWGSIVHRCVDAMARGRSGDALRAFVTAVIREGGRHLSEIEVLMSTLDAIRESPAWRDLPGAGLVQSELAVMRVAASGSQQVVTEGVIDLAVRAADGWTIRDWKTDRGADEAWEALAVRYVAQVRAYVDMLSAVTGEAVRGSVERIVR